MELIINEALFYAHNNFLESVILESYVIKVKG